MSLIINKSFKIIKNQFFIRTFVVVCLFVSAGYLNAQPFSDPNRIRQIIASADTFNTRRPAEKLFIHFDKSSYNIGDTLWFKAYLLNASTFRYSSLSGLFYLEMINSTGEVITRTSWPVSFGSSWGQIILENANLKEGTYVLRAYTNWMQNFGTDYFFQQQFSITGAANNWLTHENHRVIVNNGQQEVELDLQLKQMNNLDVGVRDLLLKITDGNKVLYKNDVRTSSEGRMSGKFLLPGRIAFHLAAVLETKKDTIRSVIPLPLERPENIDLQFMPEGGHMVAGLSSNIAFKAIDESGLSTSVSGKIINESGIEVAVFKSKHRGMGVFNLTPQPGERYFAVIKHGNGLERKYSLPGVEAAGLTLAVDNLMSDSLELRILMSPSLNSEKIYHIIGQSRGVVFYGANLKAARETFAKIAKSRFPTGIAHFTLFDETKRPLNERIVFINHNDNLNVKLKTPLGTWSPRDSIPVNVQVTDKVGRPVTGSFSLSVTDDNQVKENVFNNGDIVSNMLLTSDLKGFIEDPQYYFKDGNDAALDLLMLTQGWIGIDWAAVLKRQEPAKFAAEPGFSVSGKVVNLFGKPVNNARVILMATGKNRLMKDIAADKNGRFIFNNFPPRDTMAFVVQARNASGKAFGMELRIDTFRIPPKMNPLKYILKPWYVNSDSMQLTFAKNTLVIQEQKYKYAPGIKILEEVIVRTKKTVKNSNNLNGPGEADQVLDEKDMETLRNKTLRDVLVETVKGFQVIATPNGEVYKLYNQQLFVSIDGVDIRKVGGSSSEFIFNSNINAEDILGIEVMHRGGYNSRYDAFILTLDELFSMPPNGYAYIEITTRSGNGYFMKKTPGVEIVRPVSLSMPKLFYRPRYTPGNMSSEIKDFRSTIHWQPNVVTDKEGQAITSFFAADVPGTYTIKIQGSDMNGSLGSGAATVTIQPQKK